MQETSKPVFPPGSLLAAMLGERAPAQARRAARRLRAEGAPALAVDEEVADLARGLAGSEVSRSPAVLDALPPLFWLEVADGKGGAPRGWVAEKREEELAVRGFAIVPGGVPESDWAGTIRFDATPQEEDEEARRIRGLVAAVALPGMLSQMGESSPVVLLPSLPSEADAASLRGFRLSVAVPREAMEG